MGAMRYGPQPTQIKTNQIHKNYKIAFWSKISIPDTSTHPFRIDFDQNYMKTCKMYVADNILAGTKNANSKFLGFRVLGRLIVLIRLIV